jgi:pimeloyl-ACP methyl ester carboxylesterase
MRIQRQGVTLAFDSSGSGDPPMVLVHGWGTDRAVLAPVFAWARRSRRVVAVDLRGFGESDAPEQPYPIAGHADDVAFVAASLGLPPAIVVGHSMGGLVALDLAARHPERVAAAALLEPMLLAPRALDGLRPILADLRTSAFRDVVGGLMGYLAGPRLAEADRSRLVAVARSCPRHVLVAGMEGILAFDGVAAAQAVRCPLLYVGTGEPYADLDRLGALCPQLVTARLEGCGHYFPLEAPESLVAALDPFVAALGS